MAETETYDDICYDTEFIDDGTTIDFISIGIVGPDGRRYHAISAEFSVRKLRRNPWLVENVLPYLPTRTYRFFNRWTLVLIDKQHACVKSRQQIATEVSAFIARYEKPRLWAWYAAYDHVALAQLWGPMKALPNHVPMWTADIKQLCVELGDPRMPKQIGAEHDALADAEHNRVMLNYLRALGAEKAEKGE